MLLFVATITIFIKHFAIALILSLLVKDSENLYIINLIQSVLVIEVCSTRISTVQETAIFFWTSESTLSVAKSGTNIPVNEFYEHSRIMASLHPRYMKELPPCSMGQRNNNLDIKRNMNFCPFGLWQMFPKEGPNEANNKISHSPPSFLGFHASLFSYGCSLLWCILSAHLQEQFTNHFDSKSSEVVLTASNNWRQVDGIKGNCFLFFQKLGWSLDLYKYNMKKDQRREKDSKWSEN